MSRECIMSPIKNRNEIANTGNMSDEL